MDDRLQELELKKELSYRKHKNLMRKRNFLPDNRSHKNICTIKNIPSFDKDVAIRKQKLDKKIHTNLIKMTQISNKIHKIKKGL